MNETAIQLYSWPTPNGQKIHIMLEECGLAYEAHPVDIGKGDQFKPEFLAISPNNKIPAVVDPDGPGNRPLALFESGAILEYLAEKTGKFLPEAERYQVLAWLFFQVGGVGPMLGQAHHFVHYANEKIPYAIDRYSREANRLYGVMDKRLAGSAFIAGGEYTIADIAIWPWTLSTDRQGVNIDDYPNVKRWQAEIGERPAVQRGMQLFAEHRHELTDEEKKLLFANEKR